MNIPYLIYAALTLVASIFMIVTAETIYGFVAGGCFFLAFTTALIIAYTENSKK